MRHNNNGRRFRGRGNNGGGHNNHNNNNGGNRRINPRVHTFDSNGPDVRIRGNAYQITEKYLALAKDASSAGDRILAESYLQHAEHYQRLINELGEEYSKHQQAQQAAAATQDPSESEQPAVEGDAGLDDLDQGFLRRPAVAGEGDQPKVKEAENA